MTEFSGAADNSSLFDGNTLLLEVEDRTYVNISGLEITEFETSDKVKIVYLLWVTIWLLMLL